MQNFELFLNQFYEDLEKRDLTLSDIKKIAINYIKDKSRLTFFEKEFIYMLFNYYLSKCEDIKIILKKKGVSIEDLKEDDLLILDYTTRFNSTSKLRKRIEEFKEKITLAAKSYKYAFFITLTVDPNKNNYKTIKKGLYYNFKKFMDLLKRKFGIKTYIKVLEFTKAGVPHIHLLVFTDKIRVKASNSRGKGKGWKWLISQRWISETWDRYGMGKIVYIYALKRVKNTFTWLNYKPKNCKAKNISDYLTKYLKKAFYEDRELMFYWVYNFRFFTYSRDLTTNKGIKVKIPKYEFLTSIDLSVFPEFSSISDILKYIKDKFRFRRRNYCDYYPDYFRVSSFDTGKPVYSVRFVW
ncbi:hypothetical protein MHHB_P0781 [Methanofervidicoccus abyssi]|uniref:DUF8148 domain-containing protein n=1 Tax=Methanofervidicoccus abyssi TaxID=2082189 RepID=A0A401HQW6_9EURY|nr:hypothetical protein MHHB_P0781 [Methanofervidicoccus abyssi]